MVSLCSNQRGVADPLKVEWSPSKSIGEEKVEVRSLVKVWLVSSAVVSALLKTDLQHSLVPMQGRDQFYDRRLNH